MSRWSERMRKKTVQMQEGEKRAQNKPIGRKLSAKKSPDVAEKLTPRKKGRPTNETLAGRPYALTLGMEIKIGTSVNSLADLLHRYGRLFCTQEEVAGLLGVSHQTLITFFEREPEARKIFEDGRAHGKASLRRKQAALAEKNASMAIFLGMNYLDQQDMRGVEVKGKIEHEHSVIGAMLKEIDEEVRGARRLPGDDAKVIDHRPEEKNGGR